MCKKAGFLHKKAAFSQKHIFVKKQYFYNRLICKKAAFLHTKATFLQKYISYIYIYIYINIYLLKTESLDNAILAF